MKAWENRCKRCGLCCYEKVIANKTLYIDKDLPCFFLNTKTKECTIYPYRLKKQKRCRRVNLFRVMFSHSLPSSCGYVEWAHKKHIPMLKKYKTIIIHTKTGFPKNSIESEIFNKFNSNKKEL